MIPYFDEPVLVLGPLRISAFALLLVAALGDGFVIVSRRAAPFGLEPARAERILGWTLLWGFVGAHVVDLVAYRPDVLVERPFELLRIWAGLSSLGGILGGIAGALVVMHRSGMSRGDMLGFLDLLAFAFPFAWLLGRLGCALRHDHLGVASHSLLAVAFPDGARFDLGLLEFVLTVPIAACFAWLARHPRPRGLYLALFFAVYGPARFALDMLRNEDLRYLGWTPAQLASVAVAALGVAGLYALSRGRRRAV